MKGDINHGLFTGIVPSAGINVPTVAAAQAALDKHKDSRPDHLKALAPNAPKALRAEFTAWRERNDILRSDLEMAKRAEAAKPVDVIPREQPPELRAVSHEDRVAHGRLGGRPRSENPSKRALRLRAKREIAA